MNCKTAQRSMLLAESGELSSHRLRRLQEHVAGCPPCARVRGESARLMALVQEALPSGEPAATAWTRIAAAARPPATERIEFRVYVASALACAASLALAVGGWFWWVGRWPADNVQQLHTIIAMVAEDADTVLQNATESKKDNALRRLAQDLLRMEGLAADEWGDVSIPES